MMLFDGKKLKDGSKIIANCIENIKSTVVYKGAENLTPLFNIRRKSFIYGGLGTLQAIATVRGDKVYHGMSHDNVLTTIASVDKAIEGPSGTTKVALWLATQQEA
jgi:hypothetical protein|tara:strand:+ start:5421 stop:5735 length:315 start_codon:yes stop_codon:yes gene_type:complete